MYCDFYRLRERPFNVTADPKFLYLNACYREALASLNYGVTQRKGFITLIGEAGTGKTTLLKKLMDDLDENTRTVFLFNTNVSFDEILEYIFHEFELPVHNGKRLYMLQRLNTFLLDELREGRNVALLIDEAQDLEYAVMEDLRLLSNLETAKEKILQIVLSGQPELGQKLGNPNLRQLRQRVAINCRLQPLSPDELSEYIQARLLAAGCADPKLFSRDAEVKIYELSRGIPRVVNVVCDNALVIGYALGKKRIGAEVVAEAAADLFATGDLGTGQSEAAATAVEPEARPRRRSLFRRRWATSQIGLAVVVMAILIGFVGRSLLGRESVSTAPSVARRPLDVVAPAQRTNVDETIQPVVRQAARPDAPLADDVRPPRQGAPEDEEAVGLQEKEEMAVAGDMVPMGAAPPAEEKLPVRKVVAPPAPPKIAPPPAAPKVVPPVPRQVAALPAPVKLAEAVVPAPVPKERLPEPLNKPAVPAAPPRLPDPQDDAAVSRPAERAASAPAPSRAAVEQQSAPRTAAGTEEAVAAVVVQPPEPIRKEVRPGGEDAAARTDPAAFRVATQDAGGGAFTVAMQRGEAVTVQPGDSVSRIAIKKYGQANYTTLDLLKLANPAIRDIDVISVGQKIEVPPLVEGLPLLRDGDGRYALLLQSSPDQRHVNALGVALSRKGFQAEVRRTSFGGRRTVYRLLASGFDDPASARQAGEKLKRLFREDEEIAAAAR